VPQNLRLTNPNMRRSRRITAAYDDDVHPGVKNFWGNIRQNQDHPFSKHPTLAMYGDQLSRESFDHTIKRAQDKGMPGDPRQWGRMLMQIDRQITQRERAHRKNLEQAAMQIAHQIWGTPLDRMQATLGQPPAQRPEPEPEPDEFEEDLDFSEDEGSTRPTGPISPKVRKQVNKRITQNVLTQGAAVHGFMTAHHMAMDAIDRIDPQLRQLYDQISSGSHAGFWFMDFSAMLGGMGGGGGGGAGGGGAQKAGEVKLERDENGNIIIVAWALHFPVLIQELFKGTMELLSLHGLGKLDPDTHEEVLRRADHPTDEPYHIQVGPALWRRLTPFLPRGKPLAPVIAKINTLPPDDLHALMDALVDDPEKAKQLLQQAGIS
jgi:hypothetical protein